LTRLILLSAATALEACGHQTLPLAEAEDLLSIGPLEYRARVLPDSLTLALSIVNRTAEEVELQLGGCDVGLVMFELDGQDPVFDGTRQCFDYSRYASVGPRDSTTMAFNAVPASIVRQGVIYRGVVRLRIADVEYYLNAGAFSRGT
jgi:hypothetical protein